MSRIDRVSVLVQFLSCSPRTAPRRAALRSAAPRRALKVRFSMTRRRCISRRSLTGGAYTASHNAVDASRIVFLRRRCLVKARFHGSSFFVTFTKYSKNATRKSPTCYKEVGCVTRMLRGCYQTISTCQYRLACRCGMRVTIRACQTREI